jgi:hypothetical protein
VLIPVQEQWLDILPRFKKLQVFRGSGLWSSVKNNLEEMHQLIHQLAEICPNLLELDHRVLYDKYDAFKRIVISRRNGRNVSYSVLRPSLGQSLSDAQIRGSDTFYAQTSVRCNGRHFRLVSVVSQPPKSTWCGAAQYCSRGQNHHVHSVMTYHQLNRFSV